MAGFEEISKMKLSELGEEKDTEKENDTEEAVLAETTQEEEEQEKNEDAPEKEAGQAKKMAEPQGRYYRIDAKITEKVMAAFMFGHNYRQPLMIIATIIGVVWPVFMVIQNTLQHKIGVAASLQEFIAQCGMGPHKAHLLDDERILFFYVILQYNLSDIVENARFCKLIADFFLIPQFPRKIVS